MRVTFYLDAVEDQDATLRAGHPVYRNAEKVRITGMMNADGTADNTFSRDTLVSKQHIERFQEQYKAFRANLVEVAEGSPIKMWPAVTPADVKNLAVVGVTTIEQLAEIDPKLARSNEWLKPLHQKAKAWLKSLADNSELLRLEARVAELERQLEVERFEKSELLRSRSGQSEAFEV